MDAIDVMKGFVSDMKSRARVERLKERDAQNRAEVLEEQASLLELELDKIVWRQKPEDGKHG